MVRASPLPAEYAPQRFGRDLTALSGKPDQLDAPAIKLGGAAFIGRDMRLLMTQHCAPWGRKMRECEGVGGGSRCHEKYRDLPFEHGCKPLLDAPCPVVVAIGQRCSRIGAGNCREYFRRNSRRVIACEIHWL